MKNKTTVRNEEVTIQKAWLEGLLREAEKPEMIRKSALENNDIAMLKIILELGLNNLLGYISSTKSIIKLPNKTKR